jgi:hypothetical protein
MQPGPALARSIFQGLRPVLPASTPESYCKLAEACWSRNIAERPSMDEIVQWLQVGLGLRVQAPSCSGLLVVVYGCMAWCWAGMCGASLVAAAAGMLVDWVLVWLLVLTCVCCCCCLQNDLGLAYGQGY